MMDELLKKLASKGKPEVSEDEAKAKLEVIQELLEMAQAAMSDDVKSGMGELMAPKAQSVEVSAPDEESLAEGLDLAKDMVEGEELPEAEEAMEMPKTEEESEEDEDDEDEEKKSHFPGLL